MKKFELGNHSESVILSAYLKAGFTVSIPFGSGASYDLPVDASSNIFRIQVKSGWISNGVLKYKSQRRQLSGKMKRVYRKTRLIISRSFVRRTRRFTESR